MASQAPASIVGRVRDGAGEPIPDARVYIVTGPGAFPDVAALTGDDGGFTLPAATPGLYRVQAAADGFGTREAAVTVAAGERAACEIVLETC